MFKKSFGRRTTPLVVQCSCGGQTKRVQKRNYPYGRNSDSRSRTFYVCKVCSRRFIK